MNFSSRTLCSAAAALASALASAPAPAHALRLLDRELSLDAGDAAAPALAVSLSAAPPKSPLDFDLLGEAHAPPPSPDDGRMRLRKKLLTNHQRLGLALLGLQLATTAVGQLNYMDKFGTSNTGRYELTHAVLAYTTFAAFATNGTLALLAPRPPGKPNRGWDRVRVHKLGMALATAGMVGQAVVGIQTRQREGYLDKEDKGTVHLAIGYATLAAVGVAVGALVF